MTNKTHTNTTIVLSAIAANQCAHTSKLIKLTGLSRNAVLNACRTLDRRCFIFKQPGEETSEGYDVERTNGRYSDALWVTNCEVGPSDCYTDLDVIAGLLAQKGHGAEIMVAAGLGN